MINFSKVFFVLLLCFTTVNLLFAQGKLLYGRVTDQCGNPVPYASIKFKGSSKGGTWSYTDGSYSTLVPNSLDTVICTHVNYETAYEIIEGNNTINFVLRTQPPAPFAIAVNGVHTYTSEEKALRHKRVEVKSESDRIFTRVEVSAYFPGGERAFNDYLRKEIVYPDSATISEVKGIVMVSFMIGKDGLPQKITLLKGINKFTDSTVINAISKMPKWNIAMQNGRHVEQKKEVSISFNIVGQE